MTLIQKAHYAMDHGTLIKSPGTATADEIEAAYREAMSLVASEVLVSLGYPKNTNGGQ
ncbi:MAG: hypothetical protein GOVbin1454_11 [Prokaryotic dsDNA virus sp.]|nr:MAG: hypothetical protein GOVbin1454_11 [Prokaryotic dsDNA virus sp.]|tara:strand:+ start:517 stop:690 length:174 start_codon:yes stop_codon:yes gene_type:complete